MDSVWIILAYFAILIGLIGCFVPVLPGIALAYAGLWALMPTPYALPYNILMWAGIALVVVFLLDFLATSWGVKKFHGSRWGSFGSCLGAIIGIFFAPIGLILGPLAGAFLGELIGGRALRTASKSAIGSFLGFLFGVLLKVILCLTYGWIVTWAICGGVAGCSSGGY
ncbi:MAG: DUF456 domain-containing protein [Kiritimatiellae bacterium]|nr:DUF456 domain-containing protein [Kiritimatiellia bacterium]